VKEHESIYTWGEKFSNFGEQNFLCMYKSMPAYLGVSRILDLSNKKDRIWAPPWPRFSCLPRSRPYIPFWRNEDRMFGQLSGSRGFRKAWACLHTSCDAGGGPAVRKLRCKGQVYSRCCSPRISSMTSLLSGKSLHMVWVFSLPILRLKIPISYDKESARESRWLHCAFCMAH